MCCGQVHYDLLEDVGLWRWQKTVKSATAHLYTAIFEFVRPFNHTIMPWKCCDDMSNGSGVTMLTDRQTSRHTNAHYLKHYPHYTMLHESAWVVMTVLVIDVSRMTLQHVHISCCLNYRSHPVQTMVLTWALWSQQRNNRSQTVIFEADYISRGVTVSAPQICTRNIHLTDHMQQHQVHAKQLYWHKKRSQITLNFYIKFPA